MNKLTTVTQSWPDQYFKTAMPSTCYKILPNILNTSDNETEMNYSSIDELETVIQKGIIIVPNDTSVSSGE
jgi:hypothetical protein